MITFPQTDITQAYFLSVVFYLMILQHWRLNKQGSNLHEGSEDKASAHEEALHTHPHLSLTPSQGRVPKHLLVMETVALSSVLPSAKAVSTNAFSHKGQS